MVNELYFNFATGKVEGDISGCNVADVARALDAIVGEMLAMTDVPEYINYDEGKICAGNPLPKGHPSCAEFDA